MIEEASISDEKDPNALSDEIVKEVADQRLQQVEAGADPGREPADRRERRRAARASSAAATCSWAEVRNCNGLPRPAGHGRRPQLRQPGHLQRGVFGGNPSERQDRIDAARPEKTKTLWNQKPDDWGNPLRPANLNRGIYKGGRRPLDIYWRIAKGINGAQMPAHYPSPFNEKKIWDLVNFVLALPYEPELLKDAPAAAAGAGRRRERRRAVTRAGRLRDPVNG